MAVKTWMPETHTLTDLTRARMNVPSNLWGATVGGVHANAMVSGKEAPAQPIADYMVANVKRVVDTGGGVFITGPAGVGKSSLAVLVAKAAQQWGAAGYFTGVWELRENLRSRSIFDGDTSIMDRCRNVDVLVLDNLRAEDVTDYVLDARHIEELVSYREAHHTFTIVTSRLSLDDIDAAKMRTLASVLNMRLVTLALKGENRAKGLAPKKREAILGIPVPVPKDTKG